ncbi:MAG: hypothetical protein JWM19_7068, partial [Actinomycetia bacterium]|nr:hypothetical protein [Actinomycetes bacterium]
REEGPLFFSGSRTVGEIGQDVKLWERFRAAEDIRIGILDSFLIRYRVREVSISSASFIKRRKLTYAHRSRMPGMRLALLAVSYAANSYFRMRRRAVGPVSGHVPAIRFSPWSLRLSRSSTVSAASSSLIRRSRTNRPDVKSSYVNPFLV